MSSGPRNLDLHDLECFDTFLRERSVSRAAERLGLSQSSASDALARLRTRFDDPLLVRGRNGMQPTPKALALLPQVRAALSQLRGLLDAGAAFDPAHAHERFRLTASDYAQLLVVTQLCRQLQERAPGCTLDLISIHLQRVEEALDAGHVDLAIAYFPKPPEGLRRLPLFDDDYVCIVRADHPVAAKGLLSVDEFAALSYVAVAPSGLSYFSRGIDAALETQGLTRNVVVTCAHFLMAVQLVSQSNLALALPRRAAQQVASWLAIRLIEIPLPVAPLEISLYWHERMHHSAAHQWLRSLVRECAPSVSLPSR
ncbi:MAG: LysR family transcriptional regulator [Burkholderiaceae bacterium]